MTALEMLWDRVAALPPGWVLALGAGLMLVGSFVVGVALAWWLHRAGELAGPIADDADDAEAARLAWLDAPLWHDGTPVPMTALPLRPAQHALHQRLVDEQARAATGRATSSGHAEDAHAA